MIIDFECDSPTAAVRKETEKLLRSGGGFVHRGYFKLFGKSWSRMLGMTQPDFDQMVRDKGYVESAMMDDTGVQVGCIGTTGMWSSLEDRAVRELGFKGLVVSGFRENLPSNHKKYYPFYAKCVELDVPVRITSALHLYTDRPIYR